MSITITWLGHASFKLTGSMVLYIDPWKVSSSDHDADAVLISHSHYDHFSVFDIRRVEHEKTLIFAPESVVEELKRGNPFLPGDRATGNSIQLIGIPAYNPRSPFHPREKNWLGFLIHMDGKVIYYTGETALIPEMSYLPKIDILLVPVSGIHAQSPKLALKISERIRPTYALAYQWGDTTGSEADADYFVSYLHTSIPLKLAPYTSFTLPK